MFRDLTLSALAIPLIVVAFLAAMLGYFVTEQVATPPHQTTVRVSVVALPVAPTPTPSPTPEPMTPAADNGSSSGGGGSGGGCPAGCQCSGHPGGSIVIICH